MPIKLVTLKCPECGALLSIEENRSNAFCTYCGAKILINNPTAIIEKNIDAKIKESDNEKEIQLKELEILKDSISPQKTNFNYLIPIGLLLLGGGIFTLLTSNTEGINSMLSMMLLLLGFLLVTIPFMDASDKRQEARVVVAQRKVEQMNSRNPKTKKVIPPVDVSECYDKHYMDVKYIFEEAGFTNITLRPIEKRFLSKEKDGIVTTVTIKGDESFETDQIFSADVPVTIVYNKKK